MSHRSNFLLALLSLLAASALATITKDDVTFFKSGIRISLNVEEEDMYKETFLAVFHDNKQLGAIFLDSSTPLSDRVGRHDIHICLAAEPEAKWDKMVGETVKIGVYKELTKEEEESLEMEVTQLEEDDTVLAAQFAFYNSLKHLKL